MPREILQIWSLCSCQDRIVGVMQMTYEKVNTVVMHLCQTKIAGIMQMMSDKGITL